MTIQRRILAGNLAVVCLSLVPAIYAVICLDQVGRRTRRSLESGLDTIRGIDRLRSELEEYEHVLGFSPAFSGDPEVIQKTENTLSAARATYRWLKPRLSEAGAPALAQIDELLLGRAQNGEPDPGRGVPPGARTNIRGDAGGSPAAGGTLETSPEGEAHALRLEISAADQYTRRMLIEDTEEIKRDADRAGRLGLGALLVTAPLALIVTFLVVRGILRPLGRLSAGTSAVAAGRFGIELPVRGRDEISQLARAFNTMSMSLAALDRMKADFINVVAHELKTPLACIKGYAGALRASTPPDGRGTEVHSYLDRIDLEADLLARRVSELLTFGVIEAGQLKLELRDVMTEGFLVMAAEAFRPIAAERGIDFGVEVDRGVPPTFTGDPDRLNQVVLNLLDNAFKFTQKGGRVRLSAKVEEGALAIEVRDTGQGIASEQLGMIFEKYARARSSDGGGRGGTGLGLAIAHGIVLAHGGAIEARSERGTGSVFRVSLPLKAALVRGKEVA